MNRICLQLTVTLAAFSPEMKTLDLATPVIRLDTMLHSQSCERLRWKDVLALTYRSFDVSAF